MFALIDRFKESFGFSLDNPAVSVRIRPDDPETPIVAVPTIHDACLQEFLERFLACAGSDFPAGATCEFTVRSDGTMRACLDGTDWADAPQKLVELTIDFLEMLLGVLEAIIEAFEDEEEFVSRVTRGSACHLQYLLSVGRFDLMRPGARCVLAIYEDAVGSEADPEEYRRSAPEIAMVIVMPLGHAHAFFPFLREACEAAGNAVLARVERDQLVGLLSEMERGSALVREAFGILSGEFPPEGTEPVLCDRSDEEDDEADSDEFEEEAPEPEDDGSSYRTIEELAEDLDGLPDLSGKDEWIN